MSDLYAVPSYFFREENDPAPGVVNNAEVLLFVGFHGQFCPACGSADCADWNFDGPCLGIAGPKGYWFNERNTVTFEKR